MIVRKLKIQNFQYLRESAYILGMKESSLRVRISEYRRRGMGYLFKKEGGKVMVDINNYPIDRRSREWRELLNGV